MLKNLPSLTLALVGTLTILLMVRCAHQPVSTLHEEWLAPALPETECLTWNEAHAKYGAKGKVLASYMVRQGTCK